MMNKKILSTVAVAATLALSLGGIASAQGLHIGIDGHDGDNRDKSMQPSSLTAEVHIQDNGSAVLVRGAKVTAVSGSTVSAATTWGSSGLNWTVQTNGSTSFVTNDNNTVSGGAAGIHVGDTVNFQGSLNTASSGLVVNATMLRDVTLKLMHKTTFQGTLKSIAGTTVPTSFVMTVGNTDYTVNVGSGISILNKNWLLANLSNFHVGDTVRVYGAVQANNSTTIDASAVRDTSI